MTRTGRPPIQQTEKVAVRHIDTGKAVAWAGGVFAGDPELVESARIIHSAGEPVAIGPGDYPMTDDAGGAAAAMLAACCGRGEVTTGSSLLVGKG